MKKSLVLSFAVIGTLLVTGCAANESEPENENMNTNADATETNEDNGNDAEENDAEGDEGDGNEAAEGDETLIFARGGDSVSLDFASVTDGESSRVTEQIYESLLSFEEDSFEIQPGLAEDWEMDEDGLRYVFTLREGVTFHDGTDFDAEAVVTNFERWADPDHEFNFADEGYAYAVYGTQFGGFEGDEGHVIDEVNAISDYEVEFVLNSQLGSFLQNMGMSYFSMTSPAALEEHGPEINENPVGTGPFEFVSWSRDDSIVLEKYDDYWQEDLPHLEQVIFQVIPDNSARLTALRSGEIDIMDGLNPDDLEALEGEEGITTFERATNNIGYLGFNGEKEPFDDPEVRRALNHAIDKESLIDLLYAGNAEPAKNLIPPDYLGYNDEIDPYEYDPELAEQMLADAGQEGLEFDLWTMPVARPYMPDPERAAEVMQANFADIGVTANIYSVEWATYLEQTEAGEHDLYMLGWSGVNGDPDYFFGNLLHSDAIPGGNRDFYRNDEVDSLLDEAKVSIDEAEREELYMEAQEIIHDDAPMIPLVHSIPVLAGSERVQNYVPHPSTSEALTEVELSE